MTNEQKRRLAIAAMDKLATLAEFFSEDDDLADIDPREGIAQLAKWAYRLPTGDVWDARLPLPER